MKKLDVKVEKKQHKNTTQNTSKRLVKKAEKLNLTQVNHNQTIINQILTMDQTMKTK